MSTAFTITAPSGGISPSSASMRVSSVAHPPLSGEGDAGAGSAAIRVPPPPAPPAPSPTPPSGGAAGASSSARYARGVTTASPGAASMISRSSRRAARRPRARAARRPAARPGCARSTCDRSPWRPGSAPRAPCASSRWWRTATNVTDGSSGLGVATSSASKSMNRSRPVPVDEVAPIGQPHQQLVDRRGVVGPAQAIEPHQHRQPGALRGRTRRGRWSGAGPASSSVGDEPAVLLVLAGAGRQRPVGRRASAGARLRWRAGACALPSPVLGAAERQILDLFDAYARDLDLDGAREPAARPWPDRRPRRRGAPPPTARVRGSTATTCRI